jgi:hypothetical protein
MYLAAGGLIKNGNASSSPHAVAAIKCLRAMTSVYFDKQVLLITLRVRASIGFNREVVNASPKAASCPASAGITMLPAYLLSHIPGKRHCLFIYLILRYSKKDLIVTISKI